MPPMFSINQRPPFQDPMETLGVQAYDVIKIRNVPFAVTIAEIKSLVSRLTTSPLIKHHEQGLPVHIIMERPTGKTMDCYVEFQNAGAAQSAVSRAERFAFDGKALKIGARHVDVELSNEGELCAAIFPRAKSVKWDEKIGVPKMLKNQDPYSEGFQGFITIEEISSVCKQAANPQKSTFSQRCPQRVYESMMSTLYKFPWHVPMNYSVNTRNFLWSAYMDMLNSLMSKVQPIGDTALAGSPSREVGLSQNLLMDFLFAGLNVPMFSLRQKFMIVYASGPIGRGMPIQRQAMGWPFQCLIPAPDCPPDVLDEWLDVLEIGFQEMVVNQLRHKYEPWVKLSRDDSGHMKFELNDDGRSLTFAHLISLEMGLMEILVEHGREAWCAGWGVPYQPLNMWGPLYAYSYPYDNINEKLRAEGRSGTTEDNDQQGPGGHDHSYSHMSLHNVDDGALSSHEDDLVRQIANEAHTDSGSAPGRSVTTSHFNPASPPFIPSRPWTGADLGEGRNNLPPANAPCQPRLSSDSLSYKSTSSWTSPQSLPPSRRPMGQHFKVPAQASQLVPNVSEHLYDPFINDSSPRARRRSSVRSGHRSVSNSPSNSDSVSRAADKAVTEHKSSTSSLPFRPVFGSIWGSDHVIAPSVSPAAIVEATHRPAMGMPGSPSCVTKSRSTTPVHDKPIFDLATEFPDMPSGSKSEVMGISASRYPARCPPSNRTSAATPEEPTYSAVPVGVGSHQSSAISSTNSSNSWAYGSPGRVRRSRSSTGHHTIRIQATIDEEGDTSGTETFDGADDDATDTGGVNL